MPKRSEKKIMAGIQSRKLRWILIDKLENLG